MSSYQKVIICGNLGQEPTTRVFDNGGQVSNFSVATSEKWNDKNTNEKRELTEWHSVVVHGKLSEIVDKYLDKGDKVLVEGTLRTRKWKGTDDVEKYTTEIICRNLTMLSTKSQTKPVSSNQEQSPKEHHPDSNNSSTGDNDDLPF
tara:strand:- start:35731 stop:36168 length:438 start_codon:yes stop_codon:yes gene_type:complete